MACEAPRSRSFEELARYMSLRVVNEIGVLCFIAVGTLRFAFSILAAVLKKEL